MMKLGNIKVGTKLVSGFIIVAVLVGIVGMVGLNSLEKVMTTADVILDEQVPMADASMESTINLLAGGDAMAEFPDVDQVLTVARL